MIGQIPKFDFLWKPYNVCVNNLLKSCLIPFIIKRFFHHFFHDHTILLFCSLSLFSHILFLVRFCLEFSVQRLILCRVILPFCTHYIYPPPTLLSRDNANNFIGSLHIHFSTSFTLKWSMLDTEKPKLVLNMWHKTTKNKNDANLDLIQKHIFMWNNKSCYKIIIKRKKMVKMIEWKRF